MTTLNGRCSDLNMDRWPRRKHFEFFREFEQPFFNITVQADVSAAWVRSREDKDFSFVAAIHHAALMAASHTECFRYRIREDRVIVYDVVHGGSTVLLDDETFTFGYFDFDRDFETFQTGMRASIASARSAGHDFDPKDERDDLIHFTSIPWIEFIAIRHPRRPIPGDSVPKIAFGKCHEDGGRFFIPMAIDAHHALVDGLHVARFLEKFESFTNKT
jgi:chloramphenicol O-acetyltransferase type A